MKTIENADGNWWDRLQNRLAIDMDSIRSFAFSVGPWGVAKEPSGTVIDAQGVGHGPALFYNGFVFLRLIWPFGIYWMIRWSGSTTARSYWQAGIGYKLNGRLAALFRIQSDESASSTNPGEVSGWARGAK